jgi:hypothetical protein
MAANEHKNLTDINRHNPMGFENATNDTLLSKNSGTSATGTDGNLVWLPKSSIKTNVISTKGYTVGNGSTYEYGQPLTDAQAPFEHNGDYTSAVVGDATLSITSIFRAGGFVAQSTCSVMKIKGWMVGSGTTSVNTLAICKVTPTEDDSSALTPVLIKELSITSNGNNNLFNIEESSTFDDKDLSAGDIVFAMIKTSVNAITVYFNVTIELGYDN